MLAVTAVALALGSTCVVATADTLYVSSFFPHSIFQVNPDGSNFVYAPGLATSSYTPVFNASGALFESEYFAGQIDRIAADGSHSLFVNSASATGLAFAGNGDLYAADYDHGNIYKITPGGVSTTFASGLVNPFGLTFDTQGNLFVADNGANVIDKIDKYGNISVFASVARPTYMAFDVKKNLFVSSYGDYEIYKITPAQVKTAFAPVASPDGLAFDSAGYLYAAQEGGSIGIVKIATTGTETLFSTGIPEPIGLAFRPNVTTTPEPGAIGLIAACGLTSALAVRRKQKA